MDSESMSRSSTNDFSGVTSAAGTPAMSSMMSPRPVRMSCSETAMIGFLPLICIFRCLRFWNGSYGPAAVGLRDLDDLCRVREPGTEPDQQGRGAGRDLPAFDHAGE